MHIDWSGLESPTLRPSTRFNVVREWRTTSTSADAGQPTERLIQLERTSTVPGGWAFSVRVAEADGQTEHRVIAERSDTSGSPV